MSLGTFVVLLVLCGVVALVIRSMIKDKKAGKSLQCGMSCSECSGHCSSCSGCKGDQVH